MNKYTEQLFILINEAIGKFLENNPEFSYSETAMNAVVILTSSLVNEIAKGMSLKEKLKLLDDLMKVEKEWIKHDHEKALNE